MDLDDLEKYVDRRIALALQRVDKVLTVQSVNTDGTVTLDMGAGEVAASQPALTAYTNRAAGDVVLARVRGGEYVVQGPVGAPQSVAYTTIIVDNASAPGGAGWEEVVSGQVWMKASTATTPGAIWAKRVVTAPPPTGGTVTQTATAYYTYRGGTVSQTDKAEQGDYSGLGLQTGLATFGAGAWSALSGRTATGGTLTIHRRAGGHGFTYGRVNATAWRANAATPPPAAPTLSGDPKGIAVALNETNAIGLDAAWCQPFCAGTASAVGFYSGSATENVEIDGVTLSINYT